MPAGAMAKVQTIMFHFTAVRHVGREVALQVSGLRHRLAALLTALLT